MFLYAGKEKNTLYLGVISGLLLGGSVLTLAPYFFNVSFSIDTLFVPDPYSTTFPGRMARATGICFLIYSLAVFGKLSGLKYVQKTADFLAVAIGVISLQVIVTYILQINAISSVLIFNSMAIHTAVLLLLTSFVFYTISKRNESDTVARQPHAGSKLARNLIPFVIALPIVLSFSLIYILNKNWLSTDVSISLYTITYIVLSLLYMYTVTGRLNKADIVREQLERSLFNTNQELMQFKYALDASSIVMITDTEGIITYVNDKFCEISKCKREEAIGTSEKAFRSGHHSKNFHRKMFEQISNGMVWSGGVKKKDLNGNLFWIQTAVVPFKDEKGNVYQYLTIGQDISRQKWLATQYESLKLKTKEMEQFTYIASHDLQEPLRTVRGMSNILQKEYTEKLDKDGTLCVDYIAEATDRMSELIKALLDYSRIGIHQKRKRIDCNTLIDIVLTDLSVSIQEANATVTHDQLPSLLVYPIEFRLLLQNLISNAIKFRKKDEAPKVHVSSVKKDQVVTFSVKDNGIGIEEKYSRTIFAIFKRLHAKDEFEGTGIGLAHCEKIVHLHGGDIWVTSE